MNGNSRQERIPGYLYALDGIRAISLILIVIFHTWQQSWIFWDIKTGPSDYLFNLEMFQRHGYVAIDAFFVISGFCLFYPIARDMFGESTFSGWKNFFIKRARRIYPSYLLMLVLLLIFPVLSYDIYDKSSVIDVAKHFLSHVFFVHTWNKSTLGTTISTAWTMGIEVQFYLLFPLICIPFRKKPLLTFAGMFAFSQMLRYVLVGTVNVGEMTIQAITPAYLDVFGWGMISAYFVVMARNKIKNIDKLKLCMTIMSALCIFIAVGYMYWLREARMPEGYNENVYFRFLYRTIFSAAIAGFIFTACFSYDFWEKKIWGNRFFVFLSGISYTVYLWHQNLYIFLKKINVPYSAQNPVMNDRPAMEGMVLICLTLSVIIGVVVTKYIETPIVKYGVKGCFMQIKEKICRKNVKAEMGNKDCGQSL